jgi:L-fucose isomerase
MQNLSRVGVVTFADSRSDQALAAEAFQYMEEQHKKLVAELKARRVDVIDPLQEETNGGGVDFSPITSLETRERAIQELKQKDVQALVIGSWRWTEPMPIVDLVRRLSIPTALFGYCDADWSGFGGITAIGSALWEVSPHHSAVSHVRIRDDIDELAKWARGVCALEKLKRANLLLWGGVICMGMEHLLDDLSGLKAWLVGDIIGEGQYYLIRRAEAFLAQGSEIDAFIDWLETHGAMIRYDDRMLTTQSFRKEIALYLAAEKRIEEYGPNFIDGVSVLCHKELSVEYGVTPCLIPALLPFPENHRGKKRAIPTVCEGDVKSLITNLLMHYISPDTPAQFGDLREIRDAPNWIVIANCGGSSIFYANDSIRAKDTLPYITIQPQIHGVSGAAITFKGKGGPATIARLVRIKGEYWMHLGLGERVEVNDEIMRRRKWAKEWPTVIIDLGVNSNKFARVAGSNHYLLIPGDYIREINYACREAGIPVLRIDSSEGIDLALERMLSGSSKQPW